MASAGTNTFVIMGHGTEEIIDFDTRDVLEDGYTLITVAECGIVATHDEVCPFINAFSNGANAEIFQNPVANKEKIEGFMGGKGVHIYTPGMRYPKLVIQMFLDWVKQDKNNSGKHTDYIEIVKSGTYKFPIDIANFLIGDKGDNCDKMFKRLGGYKTMLELLPDDYSSEIHFAGSLIPTVDEVNDKIAKEKRKAPKIKKSLYYPLDTIFKRCGPGIYYYIVCRSPREMNSPHSLSELISNTNYEHFKKFGENWASHTNELLPLLQSTRLKMYEKYPKGWILDKLNEMIHNYEKLKLVPLIRKRSINQQKKSRRTTTKKLRRK